MIEHSLLTKALHILCEGGLVAFPTETVYGLGADARNPEAVEKIFIAKSRPMDHPLIVHLAHPSAMVEWARDIPASAYLLAEAFWPGPLTLILKKSLQVHDFITGKQDTIGLRIPNHPVALELLTAYGSGLAAPSANRFGRISPTTAAAVQEELGDAVDCILDGGACQVGIESTILDLSADQPVILRPGMISATAIEKILSCPVLLTRKNAPRVSGALESHYAPVTKTVLVKSEDILDFLENSSLSSVLIARQLFLGVTDQIILSKNPVEYAHDLYHSLRELDKKGFEQIVIEMVPEAVEWDAVRDRLKKAAGEKHPSSALRAPSPARGEGFAT